MTKTEELNLFLTKADELIESQYILVDVKIVGLLKAIASSETLIAIFKNCLSDFNVNEAEKKYLVKSPYLSDNKGEFLLPSNSKELLAFVFHILMELDSKNINLSEFISKYFYEDGSTSAGYSAFITKMIKPFRNTVKALMESVIDGKVQDPILALMEEEARRLEEEEQERIREQKEKEIAKKTYGESIKAIKNLLLTDKTKVKESRLKEDEKEEIILAIDMLANVVESSDKDALIYAHICYKYIAKAHPCLFFKRNKKINKLVKAILNEL